MFVNQNQAFNGPVKCVNNKKASDAHVVSYALWIQFYWEMQWLTDRSKGLRMWEK